MSASVYNSIPHDLHRLPSTGFIDRKNLEKALPKVRRALFGPIDHSETQRMLDIELTKQAKNNSQKWEFDFINEVPLSPTGTKGRYIWSVVTPPGRLGPNINRMEVVEDNSHLYNTEEIQEFLQSRENAKLSVTPGKCDPCCTKQNLITDYMPVKKRSCDSPARKKRLSALKKPSKMARTSQKDVAS